MKNILKRTLAFVLLAIMLLSVFTACEKKEEESKGDQIEGSTDENPNIPGKDYGGHEFTFITNEGNSYNTRYLVADEDSGEVMGDAYTKRNSALEQKYNIKIVQKKVDGIVQEVRSAIMSGTVDFDAILASGPNLSTMANENLLYNLRDVERFDFTKSYWDRNAYEQLTMGDKLYYVNCAMNIHSLGWVMYFNKYLIEEYGLTSPYEMIENNTWTIDNWAELVKAVNKDLDGDGQMTVADRFGLLHSHSEGRMFSYAAGIRATTNDENGKPVVTLLDDKTKLENIYTKLGALYSDTEHSICTECDHKEAHGWPHKWRYARYLFTQDYYLFVCADIASISNFTEMEHEFGILPFPKYDENQEVYMTQQPANYNLFALPSLIEDKERTFNIIEDMNYYSSFIVYPAWFEVLLTRRYARDDESEATLRMLKENRIYDAGMFYDFGGLRTKIMDMDLAKNSNVIRNYERYKKTIQMSIDATYDKFMENTGK